MSQALYRKWRPRLWKEVVGQDHVIHTLQNAIRSDKVAHAYLFAGPRGTGKTTTARLLAKAVNCLSPQPGDRPCDQCEHCQAVNAGRFLDLIEIDAASNTSVDDVRELRDKINYSPTQGKYKIYIIDEVHMLSTAAFNALLKTLEEPPPHAIFILATTEVHKIPATVLSRCQRHEFRRIPVNDIVSQLKQLVEQEKFQVEPEALTLIARQATGSLRDAISLLDQLASSGEQVTLQGAQEVLGTATTLAVVDLVSAMLARQAAQGLDGLHRALDAGADPRQFARQVVEYLRGLLLIQLGSANQVETTNEMRSQMAQHARAFDPPRLLEAIRLFNNAATDARSGWQPSLLLELALAEMIEEKTVQPSPQPAAPPTPQPAARIPDQPPAQTPTIQPPDQPATQPATPTPARTPSNPPAVSHPAEPPPAALPEQAAAPAAPPVTENASGITLGTVQQHWPRIRTLVKKKRASTEALFNSCKLLSFKGNLLTLGFASEVLKSKMEAPENLDLATQAISYILGTSIGIACVVTGQRGTVHAPDAEIPRDGMVGEALNLGGKIVQKD